MNDDSRLDKSPQRIQGMFDRIAPRYDFLNHLLSLGIDRSWRRKTASRLLTEQTPPGPVLDVCCGTGDLTLEFWRRDRRLAKKSNSERRELFGVDFSSGMIERAERKFEKLHEKLNTDDKIEIAMGDALNLSFDDDRFALVVVAFGLRNVGDTGRALTEMIRVCKPDGFVGVLEFSMPTHFLVARPYRFYFQTVLPRIGQLFARKREDAYNYLPESVLEFDEPHRLADRMDHLGLIDLQVVPMTFGIASLVYGRVKR